MFCFQHWKNNFTNFFCLQMIIQRAKKAWIHIIASYLLTNKLYLFVSNLILMQMLFTNELNKKSKYTNLKFLKGEEEAFPALVVLTCKPRCQLIWLLHVNHYCERNSLKLNIFGEMILRTAGSRTETVPQRTPLFPPEFSNIVFHIFIQMTQSPHPSPLIPPNYHFSSMFPHPTEMSCLGVSKPFHEIGMHAWRSVCGRLEQNMKVLQKDTKKSAFSLYKTDTWRFFWRSGVSYFNFSCLFFFLFNHKDFFFFLLNIFSSFCHVNFRNQI